MINNEPFRRAWKRECTVTNPLTNAVTTFVIETDSRSRAVLPGNPNRTFLAHVNEDGSMLLEPARVISEAQYEYDTTPELQELLLRAEASPTLRRDRRRREI
jgi:hypothetical protein